MPQDVGELEQSSEAVWVWDLGLRRIRFANANAIALWGADSEIELFSRVFGPSDPMTRAGAEARARLDAGEASIRLIADIAGFRALELRCDQATRAPHLITFSHNLQTPPIAPTVRDGLPESAFDAAPFPMTVLSASGAVLRENPAAEALFGAARGVDWLARHADDGAVETTLAHAAAVGGAGYVARLRVLGGRRRLSINLTALGVEDGPEPQLLASATPIPEAEDALLSGNAAEDVLHAAPSAVAVFSLETEDLLYANAAAIALSDAFSAAGAPGASLQTLFPADAAALRSARREVILDTTQTPRSVSLQKPGAAEDRLFTQATIGLWRGAAALLLWMWPHARPPEGAAPIDALIAEYRGAAAAPAAEPAQPRIERAAQRLPAAADLGESAVDHSVRIRRAALIAKSSHAMRTNITSIRGFAELLQSAEYTPEAAQERLSDILSASDALSETLEAFLGELMQIEG